MYAIHFQLLYDLPFLISKFLSDRLLIYFLGILSRAFYEITEFCILKEDGYNQVIGCERAHILELTAHALQGFEIGI